MNLVDLVIVVACVGAGYWGASTGLALQVGAFAGAFLGLVAGAWTATHVASATVSPGGRALIVSASLVGATFLFGSIGAWAGGRVQRLLGRVRLSRVDRVVGAATSVVGVLVVVWVLGATFGQVRESSVADQLRSSAIVRRLDSFLPPVPEVTAQLARYVDPLGFPQVFSDLGVTPSAPVDPPASADVQAAAQAGEAATVKVLADGCGGLEGSGVVVGPQLVATNAHVVAGTGAQEVIDAAGGHRATVVHFDPGLDVAILRVPGLRAAPLELASQDVSRGDPGAVLGYPGNGSLTVSPAAVRRRVSALGRDIYDRAAVEREVIELQTVVRPGNSGGPFVLPDGTVGGLVFASSITDPNVGYALTASELEPAVSAAATASGAVATGGCVAD